MLARDFIQDSMYHRTQGYFATGDYVNFPTEPLQFPTFLSEYHYRLAVDAQYRRGAEGSWLTPCESESAAVTITITATITITITITAAAPTAAVATIAAAANDAATALVCAQFSSRFTVMR